LRAYFIPLARLGFPLQGFLPSREPFPLSGILALLSLPASLLFLSETKRGELAFRALLPLEVRGSPACCYACRRLGALLGFHLSRVPAFRSWFAFQRPSPLVLRQELVRDDLLLAPQGLTEPKA
jgi:hypothetical protein